jgi:hypothetical protein
MPSYKYGRTARERVLSRLIIDSESGCLLWTGRLDACGYGTVGGRSPDGIYRPQEVHRVAYQMLEGPIPDGMELDHLCRVRRCASPAHLEPVTRVENNLRMHAARRAGR